MNELLYETYRVLRGLGEVKSENDFSRKYLGRSDRIMSWIKASGHPPAIDMMLGLYARLDDYYTENEATGNLGRAKVIDGLTNRLWATLREESIRKGPNRRVKVTADHDTVKA